MQDRDHLRHHGYRLRPSVLRRLIRGRSCQQLVRAYKASSTVLELKDQFGIARTTVLGHLQRQGIQRRHQSGLTDGQVREAAQLYREGLSLAAIGERPGLQSRHGAEVLAGGGGADAEAVGPPPLTVDV